MVGAFRQRFFIRLDRLFVSPRPRQSVAQIVARFRVPSVFQRGNRRCVVPRPVRRRAAPRRVREHGNVGRLFARRNAQSLFAVGARPQVGHVRARGNRRQSQHQRAQPPFAESQSGERKNEQAQNRAEIAPSVRLGRFLVPFDGTAVRRFAQQSRAVRIVQRHAPVFPAARARRPPHDLFGQDGQDGLSPARHERPVRLLQGRAAVRSDPQNGQRKAVLFQLSGGVDDRVGVRIDRARADPDDAPARRARLFQQIPRPRQSFGDVRNAPAHHGRPHRRQHVVDDLGVPRQRSGDENVVVKQHQSVLPVFRFVQKIVQFKAGAFHARRFDVRGRHENGNVQQINGVRSFVHGGLRQFFPRRSRQRGDRQRPADRQQNQRRQPPRVRSRDQKRTQQRPVAKALPRPAVSAPLSRQNGQQQKNAKSPQPFGAQKMKRRHAFLPAAKTSAPRTPRANAAANG